MTYITKAITFRVPQNGGFQYRMYECADQIADLLDLYFDTQIEDISRITDLIDDEIKWLKTGKLKKIIWKTSMVDQSKKNEKKV